MSTDKVDKSYEENLLKQSSDSKSGYLKQSYMNITETEGTGEFRQGKKFLNINQKLDRIEKMRASKQDYLEKSKQDGMIDNSLSSMDDMHEDIPMDENELAKQNAMSSYESLDYEICRNEPFYMHLEEYNTTYEKWFYLHLTLIGIIVGISGAFLDWGMTELFMFKTELFMSYYSNSQDFYAVLIWLGVSIGYGMFACLMVVFFFKASSGGGLSEIKAYLNGVNIMNLTTFSTGLSKLILTMFAVASSLYVGIEAPMIHVGAVIGASMANMPKFEFCFPGSDFYKRFRDDHSKRDLLTCGAAAGVVAGFLSPLGGIVFAIEEASTFWTIKMTMRTFYISMITGIVVYFCDGFIMNNYYVYNLVRFGNFFAAPLWSMFEYPVIAILGVLCGILGGSWNVFSKYIMEFRFNHIMGYNSLRILEVLIVIIISAGLRIIIPMLMDTCYKYNTEWACNNLTLSQTYNSVKTLQLQDYVQSNCLQVNYWLTFNCPTGYYNPSATLFTTAYNQFFESLFHSVDPYGIVNLALYTFVAYVLVALVNFTAVPMGLFMPAMAIGAGFGRLYIEIIRQVFDITTLDYLDPGFYSLLGAAGMVSGMTRLMFTVIVIFYDVTNRATTCLPLMIICVLAKYVGDSVSVGIYDIMMEIKTIPYIELEPHYNYNKKIKAKEIMSKPCVTFNEVEKVSVLLEQLKDNTHNGFPTVSSEGGVFTGVILRHQLVVLLKNSHWFTYPFGNDEDSEYAKAKEYIMFNNKDVSINKNILRYYDFTKSYESKVLPINYDDFKFLDKNLWIDLRPYTNKGAINLNENAPIERVFDLFRALGIRHLTITSNANKVKGIITRKDIMTDYTKKLM